LADNERVLGAVGDSLAGIKIDWAGSQLLIGKTGSGQSRFDIDLGVKDSQGRTIGKIQSSWDPAKNAMNLFARVKTSAVSSLFGNGTLSASNLVKSALSPFGGLGNSADFLKGGVLDLEDGEVVVGHDAGGASVLRADVGYRDATGQSLGRLSASWDAAENKFAVTWKGDLSDSRVAALENRIRPAARTVDSMLDGMGLPADVLGAMKGNLSGMTIDLSGGELILGASGSGEKIYQSVRDVLRNGVKVGSSTAYWDGQNKGFGMSLASTSNKMDLTPLASMAAVQGDLQRGLEKAELSNARLDFSKGGPCWWRCQRGRPARLL
jgi:hypothetical protein